MRVRTTQRAQFARCINRNGEGIRESVGAVFEPAYLDDPAGFKGYFSKIGLEVRVFGRRLWFVEDRADSFGSIQR
jgi:hypothetical protein